MTSFPYFWNPQDHLANYLKFIWVDPFENHLHATLSPIWCHPHTHTHTATQPAPHPHSCEYILLSGLIHFGFEFKSEKERNTIRFSTSPNVRSLARSSSSMCGVFVVMVESEGKPFMVLRLIHTSYKGLISIYSYDTHKTGITFKLMLSSWRFTFIFGNPRLSLSSPALLSARAHILSLILFSAPKNPPCVEEEDEVPFKNGFTEEINSKDMIQARGGVEGKGKARLSLSGSWRWMNGARSGGVSWWDLRGVNSWAPWVTCLSLQSPSHPPQKRRYKPRESFSPWHIN